jgi:hypothetical protein
MSTTDNLVDAHFMTIGDVDEERYAHFLAETLASYTKLRAKGRRWYASLTDEELVAGAEAYCRIYRHQYRTLTKA